MINAVIRLFMPFGEVSDALQKEFAFARPPACSKNRSRLQITIRGAGLTDESISVRLDLAVRLARSARPVLRASTTRDLRRRAGRAILIVFEDEKIVDGGVATARFSFLAPTAHENVVRSGR